MGDLVYFTFGPRRPMRKGTTAASHYDRALQLEASDPAAAMDGYRRALIGRPESIVFGDAHNNLGRLLHDRGDLAAAEAHYRIALCANNRVSLYWFNLGVALEDQGRAAESIVAYEQSLALDGSMADAHFNLARQIEVAARKLGDEILLRRAVRHLKQYRDLSRASG